MELLLHPSIAQERTKVWGALLFVFFFIFFAQLPFISLGIEYTDLGYHLTNQKLANLYGLDVVRIVPYWWLTDILAGAWLKISENWGLWGARLGGITIIASTVTLFASALFQLYRVNFPLVALVILSGLGLCSGGILDYNNIPQWFFALFCICFLKLNAAPTQTSYQISSGVLLAFLTFSKMPLIITLTVPLASLLICFLMQRERFSLYLSSYSRMISITFLCFAGFFLALLSRNLVSIAFSFQPVSHLHTFSSLLGLYLSNIKEKIPLLIALSLFSPVLMLLLKKTTFKGRLFFYMPLFLILAGTGIIGAWVLIPGIKQTLFFKYFKADGFSIYLACLMLCVVSLRMLRDSISFREVVLVLLASAYPLLRQLGSGSGLLPVYASVLLLGVTATLLVRAARYKSVAYTVLAPLILLILYRVLKIGYYMIPFTHICQMETPICNKIYAQSIRAKSLDALVREIRRYASKGDRILAFPHIPMIYYASETFPLGDHPWLFILDEDSLAKKLASIAKMPKPRVIVKPIIDFEDPKHLATQFGWTDEILNDLKTKIKIFDEQIMDLWSPQLVWSNDCFQLFIL